jgi:cytidylate kinase
VYLTDARFPNELDMVRSLNGLTIRLNVSDDVQSRRIMKRDHVEVTSEMRSHPSETASDSYEHYDLVINTDDKSVGEITKIILDKI